MGTDAKTKSLEQQSDPFTFFVALCFACIVTTLAHGYFALAETQKMGPSMRIFRAMTLYVLPGLVSGFVWTRWGLLIGAGIGTAVRVLSLINLGFVAPYATEGTSFSFDRAVESVGSVPLSIALAIGTAVLAAGAGWAMAARGPDKRWYRWLRKLGMAVLFLGILLAAGAWIYGFLPLTDARGFEGEMQHITNSVAAVSPAVTTLVWAGLAMTTLALLLALSSGKADAEVNGSE